MSHQILQTETPLTDYDPIPLWKALGRKFITLYELWNGKVDRHLPQEEFIGRTLALLSPVRQSGDLGAKTRTLWKLENMAASLLRHARPENTLNDPRLPSEIQPIAHTGIGVAAVEISKFHKSKFAKIIDSFSRPDHQPFCYESLGAMLCFHQPDRFRALTRVFDKARLIRLVCVDCPDIEEYLLSFPPNLRRLICHGYGRVLYFKSRNFLNAIASARQMPFLDFSACIQGIAFAYAMINHNDLKRILRVGAGLQGPEWVQPFKKGLIYALEFWEWAMPGFLESLLPITQDLRDLLDKARKGIEQSRSRGFLIIPLFGEPAKAPELVYV